MSDLYERLQNIASEGNQGTPPAQATESSSAINAPATQNTGSLYERLQRIKEQGATPAPVTSDRGRGNPSHFRQSMAEGSPARISDAQAIYATTGYDKGGNALDVESWGAKLKQDAKAAEKKTAELTQKLDTLKANRATNNRLLMDSPMSYLLFRNRLGNDSSEEIEATQKALEEAQADMERIQRAQQYATQFSAPAKSPNETKLEEAREQGKSYSELYTESGAKVDNLKEMLADYNKRLDDAKRTYGRLWNMTDEGKTASRMVEDITRQLEQEQAYRDYVSGFLTQEIQNQRSSSGSTSAESAAAQAANDSSATQVPKTVQEQNLEYLEQVRRESLNPFTRLLNTVSSGAKNSAAQLASAGANLAEIVARSAPAVAKSNELTQKALGRDTEPLEQKVETFTPGNVNKFFDETQKRIDKVYTSAEKDKERAQYGLGKVGKVAVDVGVAGTQMLGDIAATALTGGTNVMPLLAARSYGGGVHEARQAGANLGQQVAYGAASAAVEAVTEKISDVLGIVGGGASDDVARKVISKLATTDAGRTVLRVLSGMGGEAVEEIVSEAVNPAIKAIYDSGAAAQESYKTAEGRKELAADAAYSGLIGALLGGAGGTASIATGKNAAELDLMREADAERAAAKAATPAQTRADQGPATRNPLYEALRPRTEPAAESATASQTPENAPQTQEAPVGQITQPSKQDAAQAVKPGDSKLAETATEQPKTLEERRKDWQRRFDDALARSETADSGDAALSEEFDALDAEDRQLEAEETQVQRVQGGEVSNGFGTPENHIDRRTPESVGNTGVKSFQFDNPQLHGYYVEAAQALFNEVERADAAELERAMKRERGSAITGPIRRLMDLGLTKPQIVKCLQDIIADNGQENYAAAKRVELVLNDMLTNGWQGQHGRNDWHEANADYIAAKDAIDGGIKADSWERFLAQNELSLIDGTVTEEELRAEWERKHQQAEGKTNADLTAEEIDRLMQEAFEHEQAAKAYEEQSSSTRDSKTARIYRDAAAHQRDLADGLRKQAEGERPSASAEKATGAERTNGQDERGYTGPLVDTQDRVFETQLTDEEKQIPGLTAEEARHIQHHDAEVDARAKARIAAGAEQARAELLAAESWSDEDTATAGYIIQAELEAAEKAGSVEERAAIYKRLAELKKQWNKQGTEQGRALRQRQRFVAEDMVSAAADILYSDKSGKNEKALRKLNPQAKDAIMGKVREYARRFNDMQKNGGTVGDLIQLIKDVSVQRRTTGLFSRENGRAVDFALSEVAKQEGGVDFLKELATTQIKSIASDYLKPGIIDQIKSWRFMAMLSNAATTTANAGSNFVFGSFMEAMSGNLALPFDVLMSQVTGQREVAGELGAFSKTKWQGSYDAMLRSFLEVTLDAETEQADYGYKELKGGTFKMVGNPLERLLATMQKYQGYALKTTDQAAKGGAEAQVRKGLGKLAEQGKAKAENIDALAQQEAKYRTLQTEGAVSRLVQGGRRLIDETRFLHIGNERTGKYGLGSDIMPFAQVPANAVAVTLESNPAIGAAKALIETAKVLADGKNVEPGQQAKAARAWGRVANGAAVAATFAALAAKGYLRDEDDENKDIAAQRKAEGRSGVQLNISALLRGDPSEREDDLWIDFSWIPPLNGLANFGIDMYRAYTEDGHISFKDVSLASGYALASAFMDFPAVSKISSMIQTYRYSEADGILGKVLETGVTGAAQTASSILVPNAVRAAAAGLDPYERDVYNTDTYGQGIRNNLIAGIPGLRQTLPERLDTFGQPVKNEGGALHFLDKTLIPGNVSQHNRQSAASKYVEYLIAKTGDKKLQPSRNPPYKATLGEDDDKQSVELTAAERREYQQTRGNAITEMTEALAESRVTGSATDWQKALFTAIKNAANHTAEADLAESRGIEQAPIQINGKNFTAFAEMGAPESVLDRLAENGMTGSGRNTLWEIMRGNGESARAFADTEAQIVGESGTASQARVFEALRGKDYTAEEKQQIWEAYSPSGKSAWKTSYADYAAKNGGDESKATRSSGNVLYDYYAERQRTG